MVTHLDVDAFAKTQQQHSRLPEGADKELHR